MGDITHKENGKQVALATPQNAITLSDMFSSMVDLAKDPDVDPAKMEAILNMQERMIDRQQKSAFNAAMHAARREMPRITKDGKITNKAGQVQSRFATYQAIDKIVRPIIESHGLTYGFSYDEGEQGRVLVTCLVSHVDGWSQEFGPMPLSIDTTGAKNATQGAGSAGTYGQRYTLCAAFNIVTEGADDDGGAGRPTTIAAPGYSEQDLAAVVAQAEGARDGGYYADWFAKQTNVLKGWLIDNGHHARLKQEA